MRSMLCTTVTQDLEKSVKDPFQNEPLIQNCEILVYEFGFQIWKA